MLVAKARLLGEEWCDLWQDVHVGNVERAKSGVGGDPTLRSFNGGVHAILMNVHVDGGAAREPGDEDCGRVAVSVKCRAQIQIEMRDLWRDAPMKTPNLQGCRRTDEGGGGSVDDRGDEVERFNNGAFAGVVLADHHGVGLERDRVVPKATVILQTKSL